MRNKKCKICGKEFEAVKSPWNRSICSRECVYKANRERARKQREEKKKKIIVRKCRYCGKDVESTAYCPQSFCGGKYGECYKKHLSENRKGKGNPAYRHGLRMSDKPKGRNYITSKHLRACSKYKKEFMNKHSYMFCEVCGCNETMTLKFEVHHIYWASRYPQHKELHNPKNLVLVCIQCHNNFHSGKVYQDKFEELEKKRGLKELFKK